MEYNVAVALSGTALSRRNAQAQINASSPCSSVIERVTPRLMSKYERHYAIRVPSDKP